MSRHGVASWSVAAGESGMRASSPSLTPGWSRGRSLNHQRKKAPQTMPSTPKSSKARRHDTRWRSRATRNGVKAPPQRAANQMRPCARSRSWLGSQARTIFEMFGKQPASPIPKRNRQSEEGSVVPDPARRRGEERPQRHHAEEDHLRPPAVAHPAARDLERRVRPGEDEEHPPHLHARQGKLRLDVGRGLGDHDPVRVRDERERHREDDDPVPGVSGAFHGIEDGGGMVASGRLARQRRAFGPS